MRLLFICNNRFILVFICFLFFSIILVVTWARKRTQSAGYPFRNFSVLLSCPFSFVDWKSIKWILECTERTLLAQENVEGSWTIVGRATNSKPGAESNYKLRLLHIQVQKKSVIVLLSRLLCSIFVVEPPLRCRINRICWSGSLWSVKSHRPPVAGKD